MCEGGGATITDSPINVNPVNITLNININVLQADTEKVDGLIGKIFNMITGIKHEHSAQRLATIENAQQFSEGELQGSINRALQGR